MQNFFASLAYPLRSLRLKKRPNRKERKELRKVRKVSIRCVFGTNQYKNLIFRGSLNNPNFNPLEFEGVKSAAGANAFTLSPMKPGKHQRTFYREWNAAVGEDNGTEPSCPSATGSNHQYKWCKMA